MALLGREAIDWIAILQAKRCPIPVPDVAAMEDQRERLAAGEGYTLRLKSQAYDLAMALNQIFNLLRPLEDRLPKGDLDGLVNQFLSAMRSGRLVHLRDAMEHRDEFLSGNMDEGQRGKKIDTWDQHVKATRGGAKVAFAAGTKETYEASLYSWGVRFDDGGVTAVAILGRNYLLLDAYELAIQIGPYLGPWCGRLFVSLNASDALRG